MHLSKQGRPRSNYDFVIQVQNLQNGLLYLPQVLGHFIYLPFLS